MSENTGKKQDGKFIKGQSGNPLGRPKGALNNSTKAAIALLDGEIEVITRKVIEMAKSGDMQAIKLVFDKVVPTRKHLPININLQDINSGFDIMSAKEQVINSVTKGEISIAEAKDLLQFLESSENIFKENNISQIFNTF